MCREYLYPFIFQFLLVRLRDRHPSISTRYFRISIPSGAIKSISLVTANSDTSSFQFLLVRLREACSSASIRFSNSFQFLLVRLRDKLDLENERALPAFQFLLVRLREYLVQLQIYHLLFISIPSGAIKRNRISELEHELSNISIPSGAIKRC